MSASASDPVRHWVRNWSRLAQLQRSGPLRALFGANLIAIVVILIRTQGWLQPVELVIYDALRVAWAGDEPSSRILLVGADEQDIRHYSWPLRDGDLADLLERIASWKPRMIGVDIYRDFPRPPGSDRLDATLARHPEIVWAWKLRDADRPQIPPPQQLTGTDRAVLADTISDPGRVVRRGLLFADDGTDQFTAMGMALAQGYLAPEGIALQPRPDESLLLGKAVIAPLDETRGPYIRVDSRGYQLLMDYRGGAQPFPLKSVADIMNGEEAAALVRSRVVIVGVAAESVQDDFATPFSTGFNAADPIYGITIHAHLADQLIRQALDGTPSLYALSRPLENVWIWFWALAGLGLGLAIRSTLPAVGTGFAGVLVIGGIVYGAFGKALLLPALPAALVWLGSGVLTNQLLHAAANRARAHLRRSFEHYLPPALISDMLKSGDMPKLGGERRELSVVFSDIAASTTLAETVDPVDLAPLMNAYFAGVGAAIFKEGGYINEFMGDGVLAFSGRRSVSPTMPTAPSRRPCRSPHLATASAARCTSAASRLATRASACIAAMPWSAISACRPASNTARSATCSTPARGSKASTKWSAPGWPYRMLSSTGASAAASARWANLSSRAGASQRRSSSRSTASATVTTTSPAIWRRTKRCRRSARKRSNCSPSCCGRTPTTRASNSTMPGLAPARRVR